jgi:hypothetical protein
VVVDPVTAKGPREDWKAVAVGLAVCFTAATATSVALHDLTREHATIVTVSTAAFVVLTSLGLLIVVQATSLMGRRGAVASLTTLGCLPILAVALANAERPIICTGVHAHDGHTPALLSVLVAVAGAFLVPLLLAGSVRQPRHDATVRALALGSVLLAVLLSLVALSRNGRPDADHYVRSMPVVQELSLGGSVTLDDRTQVTYRLSEIGTEGLRNFNEHDCMLDGIGSAWGNSTTCEPFTVHHDAKEDLWLLDGSAGPPFAFKGRVKGSRDIYASDVAHSIAPPSEWTFAGALGALLGILLLVVARRDERRAASLPGVDGILSADGWVTHALGPPVRLATSGPIEEGCVVLQLREGSRGSYREVEVATVESWQPGTLEEARAELRGRVVALYALAMTTALLCSAPLLLTGLGGSR